MNSYIFPPCGFSLTGRIGRLRGQDRRGSGTARPGRGDPIANRVGGRHRRVALAERRALTPVTDYGMANARMEGTVQAWADAQPTDPKAVILRLGNKPRDHPRLSRLKATAPSLEIFAEHRSFRHKSMGSVTLDASLSPPGRRPDGLLPTMNIPAPRATEMAARLNAADRAWVVKAPRPDTTPNFQTDAPLLQNNTLLDDEAANLGRIVDKWRQVCA